MAVDKADPSPIRFPFKPQVTATRSEGPSHCVRRSDALQAKGHRFEPCRAHKPPLTRELTQTEIIMSVAHRSERIRLMPRRRTEPTPLPPAFAAMIASFKLELRGSKSKNTTRIYVDATVKFARWLIAQDKATGWPEVTKDVMREYIAWLREDGLGCHCGKTGDHPDNQCPKGKPLKPGYINNLYRSLQQFWVFYAGEEDTSSPMFGLKPPPVPEELVPVLTDEQRAAVLKPLEKGKTFEQRRDYALLRVLQCSGIRLEEVTDLDLDDINLETLEILVRGKGDIPRIVKMDIKTARALDRYLRMRALHKYAEHRRLWLAVNNRGPLTDNGIRQIVERRGKQTGLDLFPHLFRHDFTHRWLDAGGAEGDLMELNGWKSPQMLRRYGRSARSARARRAYDRVNVMGDL